MADVVEYHFICLFAICLSSVGEAPIRIFFVCFLLVSFKSYLFILNTNPSSGRSFKEVSDFKSPIDQFVLSRIVLFVSYLKTHLQNPR